MIWLLTSCSLEGVSEEVIQKDIMVSAPAWENEAEINSFSITKRVLDQKNKRETINIKIEGETEALYMLRYYSMSYFYDKQEGWVLSDIEIEDQDLWETTPLSGPDNALVKSSLLGSVLPVNGYEWEITEENIRDINVQDCVMSLEERTAEVVCNFTVDIGESLISGNAVIGYYFHAANDGEENKKDGWYAEAVLIDSDFVYAVNAVISVGIENGKQFGPYELMIKNNNGNPTVLQGIEEVLLQNNIQYTVDENKIRIESITLGGKNYATGADDYYIYMWTYTVNGHEPAAGRMGTNAIKNEDVIELQYYGTPIDSIDKKSDGCMTYHEYISAENNSLVTIETYVQAKQSLWDNRVTVYSQDKDGAYFIYDMKCSEEDYQKLIPGTKIKVSGYKSEWADEIEITDATFEFLSGNYVAQAIDITDLLTSSELIDYQNRFVSFKDMIVEESIDSQGNKVPFVYSWDGTGEDGDDLYFKASYAGKTYTFSIENNLCDSSSEVYSVVKNLKIGDKISMEGFLYWYEEMAPHIVNIILE